MKRLLKSHLPVNAFVVSTPLIVAVAIIFMLSGCTADSPAVSPTESVSPSPSVAPVSEAPSPEATVTVLPEPETSAPTDDTMTLLGLGGVEADDVFSILYTTRDESGEKVYRATDKDIIAEILEYLEGLSLGTPKFNMLIGGTGMDIQVNGVPTPVSFTFYGGATITDKPTDIFLTTRKESIEILDGAITHEEWKAIIGKFEQIR